MLAMSFSYHNYLDYSPVKSNLSYQFYFKYLDMYDRKKYLPYFNFQVQMIDFNHENIEFFRKQMIIDIVEASRNINADQSDIFLCDQKENFEINNLI